jgi:hypothetical protein
MEVRVPLCIVDFPPYSLVEVFLFFVVLDIIIMGQKLRNGLK